jgi:uncharacterized DUF497 family protein
MEFEWDPEKDAANAAKHGISFTEAIKLFLDPWRLDLASARAADGEAREKSIGAIDGRSFTAVFHRRAEVIRLISARPSNGSERRDYGKIH